MEQIDFPYSNLYLSPIALNIRSTARCFHFQLRKVRGVPACRVRSGPGGRSCGSRSTCSRGGTARRSAGGRTAAWPRDAGSPCRGTRRAPSQPAPPVSPRAPSSPPSPGPPACVGARHNHKRAKLDYSEDVRGCLPAIGIGNLNAVVVVDDRIVAAGRRVREAGGVASYRAHGGAREEREGAGARRPREEEGFERTAWKEKPEGNGFMHKKHGRRGVTGRWDWPWADASFLREVGALFSYPSFFISGSFYWKI